MIEEQFFSCKADTVVTQFFGTKSKAGPTGAFKNFGVICNSQTSKGKWSVLGPLLPSSQYHSAWSKNSHITSLTVYKLYDATLKYNVVTSISFCLDGATDPSLCHQLGSPCPTCLAETTNALAGQYLNYFYFKTILNSVITPGTPGNLLEMKVSSVPYAAAPVM